VPPRTRSRDVDADAKASAAVRSGPEPAPGGARAFDPFGLVEKYNANQARDERGRFTDTGTGALPTGDGIYYRMHDARREFSRDATSAKFVGFDRSTKPIYDETTREPGYSSYANPWHVAAYMQVKNWVRRPNQVDWQARDQAPHVRIIAFRGEKVGRGYDGEPLVVPVDDEPLIEMNWTEFETRLWDTEMGEPLHFRNEGDHADTWPVQRYGEWTQDAVLGDRFTGSALVASDEVPEWVTKYDPRQPRDEKGRWTDGGSAGTATLDPLNLKGDFNPGGFEYGADLAASRRTIDDYLHVEGVDADTIDAVRDAFEGEWGGLRSQVHWIGATQDGGNIHVIGRVLDENDEEVGEFIRDIFPTSDKSVHHQSLYLSPSVQGRGFAKGFLSQSEAHYRAQGMEYITVQASDDVGGYAWARAGFTWGDGRPSDSVIQGMQFFAESYPDHPTVPKIQSMLKDIRDSRVTRKPTPREISELGEGTDDIEYGEFWTSPRSGTKIHAGAAILLGSEWEGVKDIRAVKKNLDDLTDDDWKWIELACSTRVRKYSANQPREPKGSSIGGRWQARTGRARGGRRPSWSPTMTREDAEHWAKDSKIQDVLTHTTSGTNLSYYRAPHIDPNDIAADMVRVDGQWVPRGVARQIPGTAENNWTPHWEMKPDATPSGILHEGFRTSPSGVFGDGIYLGAEELEIREGDRNVDTWKYDPEMVDRQAIEYGYGSPRENSPTLRVKVDVRKPFIYHADTDGHGWANHMERIGAELRLKHGRDIDTSGGLSATIQSLGYDALVVRHTGPFEWGVGGDQVVVYDPKQAVVIVDESGQPEDYRFRKYSPAQPRGKDGRWIDSTSVDADTFISGEHGKSDDARWEAGVNEAAEMLAHYEERNLEDFGQPELDEAAYYGYQNWAASFYDTDRIQQAAINIWGTRAAMPMHDALGGDRLTTDSDDLDVKNRLANSYGNARALISAIENSPAHDVTLYRGMRARVDEMVDGAAPRQVKDLVGRTLNFGLSAFSPDQHTADSFLDPTNPGERKVMLRTKGPVKAYDASPDEWISAGAFKVVGYEFDHPRNVHWLDIEQQQVFRKRYDPNQPRDERGRWTDSGSGSSYVTGRVVNVGPFPAIDGPNAATGNGDFRQESDPARRFTELWQRTYAGYTFVREATENVLAGKDALDGLSFESDVLTVAINMAGENQETTMIAEAQAAFVLGNMLGDEYRLDDLKTDITSAAHYFADGIRNAKATPTPLYRGTTMPSYVLQDWQTKGGTVTLGPTATTRSTTVADRYAEGVGWPQPREGMRTWFHFDGSTKRFDLRQSDWDRDHPESVVMGDFKVDGVEFTSRGANVFLKPVKQP
jgi:GNAT superfamily N-acetyltransferase